MRKHMRPSLLQWSNGIDGSLLVQVPSAQEIHSTMNLVAYVRTNYSCFDDRRLELLGALMLFFALREYGAGSAGRVMYLAEKALDAFYPVLPSNTRQKYLDGGMDMLREHLFPHRSEDFEDIVSEAFSFILERLAKL